MDTITIVLCVAILFVCLCAAFFNRRKSHGKRASRSFCFLTLRIARCAGGVFFFAFFLALGYDELKECFTRAMPSQFVERVKTSAKLIFRTNSIFSVIATVMLYSFITCICSCVGFIFAHNIYIVWGRAFSAYRERANAKSADCEGVDCETKKPFLLFARYNS